MLHPDLHRLQQQYNQVLDEHEAGNLSYEDALATVQAMTVIDGGGFVWLIDSASGAFLRATPGEQPYEADPATFIPAQIPAPGSAPWASQQDLLRPPSMPSSRTPAPQHFDEYAPQGAAFDEEEVYSPMMQRRAAGVAPGASRSPAALLAKVRSVQLPPLLEKNKRLVAVAGIVLALFVGIVLKGGGEEAVPTIPPATQPPVTAPADTSATQPSVPVDPSATVPTTPPATQPPVAQDPNLPSSAEMLAALQAMVSGDRAQVRSVFVNVKDDLTLALYTARYKGYNATGLGLEITSLTIEKGKVFAEARLTDKNANNAVLVSRKVRWIRGDDGRWRINNPIDFED